MNYLQNSYSRILCNWCIDFYNQFKESPKNQIADIFSQQKDFLKKEESESIEKFLIHLNDIYKNNIDTKFNLAYELRKAQNYLKLQKLINIKNKLENSIREKNIIEAENSLTEYEKNDKLDDEAVDLLTDTQFIVKSIQDINENEFLFRMRGKEAGEYFGEFNRGDLVACLAPPKRGKTWCFIEIANCAIEMDCKVLFISMEMMKPELTRRIWSNFLALPVIEKKEDIKIPCFNNNRIEYKIEKKQFIQINDITDFIEDIKLHKYRASLKLLTFPMYSITVKDIKNYLNNFEYIHNWVPDVVIIDYADILQPESKKSEYRHTLDETWKALRNLAQDRNICVITASQGNRATFKKDAEAGDIAEDYRKLAHVTKLFGLNQTPSEKEAGLMRVNMVLDRHREFFSNKHLVLLQNLNIGKFILDSKMKKDISNYDELAKINKIISKDKQ